MAKVSKNPVKEMPKKESKQSSRSVEEIEADLQLPESSDESGEESSEEAGEASEDSLSDESDEELAGLDDEESIISKSGHSVNKTVESKSISKDGKSKKQQRGIIYIGRIPHGFYEDEMSKYFEQFGPIINLRLSRNKKTGKSKHFGFIEFGSYDVAKIAAETMNNYLLFGHLLKCEVVDSSHEDLFKDANKKFKVIPWGKISKEKNDAPKSKERWGELIEMHENSKLRKQKELKEKGIDFDLASI